jgi:large subunit ribosomal protein L13
MTRTTLATLDDHTRALTRWHLVDASKHVLGRMATAIATVLMGKHKPGYTPHIAVGEGVVVINARQLQVSGSKLEREVHTHWSGYPGGLKKRKLGKLVERNAEAVIKNAVRRMLPKSRLGRDMLRHLKVYAGPEHRQSAQQPQELAIPARRSGSR